MSEAFVLWESIGEHGPEDLGVGGTAAGHGAGETAGVVADDGERLLELVRNHRGELAHETRTLHRDEPFVVALGLLLDAPLLLHGSQQLRGAASDQVFGAHAVHDDAEQYGGEKGEPDAVVPD